MIESYDEEVKAVKEELLRICWHMRGSIDYSSAMLLSADERSIISKIIKENMDITNKTKIPFF